jgi:hypothetical protein
MLKYEEGILRSGQTGSCERIQPRAAIWRFWLKRKGGSLVSTSTGNDNAGPVAAPDEAEGSIAAQLTDQPQKGMCGRMVNSVYTVKDDHTSVSPDNPVKQESLSRQSGGTEAGSLDQDTQSAIGRQLRAMFDEIVQAPVPERFLKLLSELEKRQKRR